MTPEDDAVDRAMQNGTLKLLAWDIQKIYLKVGQWLDDKIALRIAEEKIRGHIKLPPKLGPEHIQRCPRCGRAHIMPLTKAELPRTADTLATGDAADRLCHLAQAVVNQDYGSQRDKVFGNRDSDKFTKVSDAATVRADMGGGRRLPSGRPSYDGDEKAAAGHQGKGLDSTSMVAPTRRRRRVATGSQRDNAIIREVQDELRDKSARQADETALTERKRAWMTADHGKASERQQEAQYLVHVLGLSQRSAAQRMKVSLTSIQQLLKNYAKNTA